MHYEVTDHEFGVPCTVAGAVAVRFTQTQEGGLARGCETKKLDHVTSSRGNINTKWRKWQKKSPATFPKKSGSTRSHT